MTIKFITKWHRKWSYILIRIPMHEIDKRNRVLKIKQKLCMLHSELVKSFHKSNV
jgi:hypothetical protein